MAGDSAAHFQRPRFLPAIADAALGLHTKRAYGPACGAASDETAAPGRSARQTGHTCGVRLSSAAVATCPLRQCLSRVVLAMVADQHGARDPGLGSSTRRLASSPGHHHVDLAAARNASTQAARANPGRSSRHRSAQPFRPGQARPGGGNPCTTRSTAHGRPRRCPASSAGQALTSPAPSSRCCSRRDLSLSAAQGFAGRRRVELVEDALQGAIRVDSG